MPQYLKIQKSPWGVSLNFHWLLAERSTQGNGNRWWSPFCLSWVCDAEAGLIDNASGAEIHQDHIHLMHEADNHAWKCHGLSLWSCGQAKLSSPRCHWVRYLWSQGHSNSPRHRSCPVPDKRIKHLCSVFMTMVDSVLFGYSGLPAASSTVPSTLLHTHRHTCICWPTC